MNNFFNFLSKLPFSKIIVEKIKIMLKNIFRKIIKWINPKLLPSIYKLLILFLEYIIDLSKKYIKEARRKKILIEENNLKKLTKTLEEDQGKMKDQVLKEEASKIIEQ